MPRSKLKEEMAALSHKSFTRLLDFVDSFLEEKQVKEDLSLFIAQKM